MIRVVLYPTSRSEVILPHIRFSLFRSCSGKIKFAIFHFLTHNLWDSLFLILCPFLISVTLALEACITSAPYFPFHSRKSFVSLLLIILQLDISFVPTSWESQLLTGDPAIWQIICEGVKIYSGL